MSNASFLPEDYLAQKAERRTNLICLTLFLVVMLAVFGAFLVTNQQRTQVKSSQRAINAQYQDAAQKIEKLNELDQQKDEMLNKAELAGALVERVPRSILLAELINRMPPRLSLLEFEMKSEKIKAPAAEAVKAPSGRLAGPARAKTKDTVLQEQGRIDPPRHQVEISMIGVAPTDVEVSRYMAELNAYPLLRNVSLQYSEEREIEGQMMRRFAIRLALDPDADVRSVEPLARPRRIKNPMMDEVDLSLPMTALPSFPGPRSRTSGVSAGSASAPVKE